MLSWFDVIRNINYRCFILLSIDFHWSSQALRMHSYWHGLAFYVWPSGIITKSDFTCLLILTDCFFRLKDLWGHKLVSLVLSKDLVWALRVMAYAFSLQKQIQQEKDTGIHNATFLSLELFEHFYSMSVWTRPITCSCIGKTWTNIKLKCHDGEISYNTRIFSRITNK